MANEVIYIVDTFSLIFQVFHGIPSMTGPQGQPTNAVFGVVRDLMNIRDQIAPNYLICAMDSPGDGARHEIFPEYKANRSEMPEDLQPQIPLIKEAIAGLNIPMIEQPGWEADDVIATVARMAVEQGIEVCIATTDKDARQLLNPHVKMFNVRKQLFFDEKSLLDDWGVRPDQVVDFQSLVGDSVDNIPGIPLVGPKKASLLLNKFETLEEVLAHADEAPGPKLRENLKTYGDRAHRNRDLVRLNTNLELDVDWNNCKISDPDRERLYKLFTDLGFRRFAEMMQDSSDPSEPVEREWETVDTDKKFQKFLKALQKQSRFCLDLETTSLNAVQADIVGWAFSWQPMKGYYLPVDGPPGQPSLDATATVKALKPILESDSVEVVNQNIKYDMLVLRGVDIKLNNVQMDPMVGDYLLDAGARSHSLDTLAQKYLQHDMIPISDLIGSGKQQKRMFEVNIEEAAQYASEDADIAWQLSEIIEQNLKDEGLWDLFWTLERPLIPVLVEMELNGIRVDVDELNQQSAEIGGRLEQLVTEIHDIAGREFNIASPKQLSEILFNELQLPVIKKTKTGPSTSQDVLEKLAPLHPLPAKIIDHRQLAKLKGTYLDSLPNLVNPDTKRIHASFNQVVAATGRLSSSDPNLQNIPIRTEEGRRVRKAFIPGDTDQVLLCADYSQIELRMLAHFSHDEALRQAFAEGVDIHTAVAAEIFEVETDDVDSSQRRIAKAVNFGVIYGQSPYGLSEALGIPQSEAATFIDNYFDRYAGVDTYLQQILVDCEKKGYAETILGRRRPITGIRNTTGRQRNLPERTAINSVIQGSAADLIKRAMITIHERLQSEPIGARMLLQIHDELVFEVPKSELDETLQLVRQEMEQALELSVPLVVDVAVGENWFDIQPVE